ncbi:hypothetical protein TNCV_1662641 [Trichonephila clavipes]|nr:hypothetical protein TNCV_1662641 [Trichonephila clavipes]
MELLNSVTFISTGICSFQQEYEKLPRSYIWPKMDNTRWTCSLATTISRFDMLGFHGRIKSTVYKNPIESDLWAELSVAVGNVCDKPDFFDKVRHSMYYHCESWITVDDCSFEYLL